MSAETLSAQNTRLNEEIKLLARTEQRLYAAQREVARYVRRVEALNRFALAAPSSTEDYIAASALELLPRSFSIHAAFCVLCGGLDEPPRLFAFGIDGEDGAIPVPSDGPLIAALDAVADRAPGITLWTDRSPEPALDALIGWLDDLIPVSPSPRGYRRSNGVVTLDAPGSDAFIVFRSESLLFDELAVSESDRPFLELVQQHVSTALRLARARIALERRVDAALEASHAKSQFLANMSHELRTPLNAVIGYTELLREDASDRGDEDAERDLDRIADAAGRLVRMVNEILDLTRVEAGGMPFAEEDVDLRAVVARVASIADPLARRAGTRFELSVDPSVPPVVRLDEQKLYQILVNLVSNATRFTHEGTIELAVRVGSGRLWFVVNDTGIGIAPKHLAVVFDRFVQADTSSTRRYEGSGLGLAIVKAFVEGMGGEVRLSSVVGRGTEVRVALPLRLPEL